MSLASKRWCVEEPDFSGDDSATRIGTCSPPFGCSHSLEFRRRMTNDFLLLSSLHLAGRIVLYAAHSDQLLRYTCS